MGTDLGFWGGSRHGFQSLNIKDEFELIRQRERRRG